MIDSVMLVPVHGPPCALELFQQACQPNSSIPCNIITVNTVLRHYARKGDVAGMQHLFGVADQLNLKPDIVTYTTLVQGLLRAKRMDMAKGVMETMHAAGLEPNEYMCTILITDLVKDGQRVGLQYAEDLLKEMRRKGFAVGVVTWTALVSGYFRGGWVEDGWNAVRRMEEDNLKLNRVSYNVILRQSGERSSGGGGGEAQMTLRIFNKMIRDGVRPNADTYTVVLLPLIRAQLWDDADDVVHVMEQQGFKPEKSYLKRLIKQVRERRSTNRGWFH